MRCLGGIKFTHVATVLEYAPAIEAVDAAITEGHFEIVQDDETGGVTRVWVEDTAVAPSTNATITQQRQAINRQDIPCYARGFTELGFRSTANLQRFDNGDYEAVEVIQMTFPSKFQLGRSQYITNIRDRRKNVLWWEEELGQPTIFDVQGVTPIFDPFGKHVENIAVLKRSPNQ